MRLGGMVMAAIIGLALPAQSPQGALRFSSGAKRIDLQVVAGNHPAFISLRHETGEAEALRMFLLTHSGPEKMIAPNSLTMTTQAPSRWKVSKHRGTRLIQSDEAIYWCYTPGLVLPSRFNLGNAAWKLESADLPPLMFVEMPN